MHTPPCCTGAKTHTPFMSHFCIKPIILPSQARDEHRKS
jgi:hypothetical protein